MRDAERSHLLRKENKEGRCSRCYLLIAEGRGLIYACLCNCYIISVQSTWLGGKTSFIVIVAYK